MRIGSINSTEQNGNIYRQKKKFRSYLVSERFLLSIIKILASDMTILRRQLSNIKRFLDIIDRDFYSGEPNIDAMLITCESLLNTKMKLGVSLALEDIIFNINLLLADDEYAEVKQNLIIPQIQVAKTDSIETELSYVSESLDQNLKFSYILDAKDDLYDLTSELTTCSYKDFNQTLTKYRNLLTNIMNFFRSTDSVNTLNSVMHTSDPSFVDFLLDTYNAIRNPASALQTGWTAMNSALGPRGGFQNSNLYIYHARTNSFKSAILLHIARMVKMYNAAKVMNHYKATGKIPTILFVEAENDVGEDAERLYKVVAKKDLGKCTSKEELFSSWKHTFEYDKDENPIDISFLHVNSRSMSVDSIDRVIDQLEEEGFHVIMVIADYLGILKPRDEDINKETRIQLKNIAEDLLSLAKYRDIPVVTAHQLNRSGDTILANHKMQGGANAIAQLTNEFIGESFGIEQAASWTMFIDIEVHDGKKYLTCKRNKCRYAGKYGLEYFVFEIKEGIIIEDDIFNATPLHFDVIPNTDIMVQSPVGTRGSTDIRDKPRTPKGNILDIKSSETSDIRDGIPGFSLSDIIKPSEWFNYVETYGFDTIMTTTIEFDDTNTYVGYIGETEYAFIKEETEEGD